MGHRALVAYRRGDGLYDLYYSHWGGDRLRLRRELAAGRPFGAAPGVDPEPVAAGVGLDAILAEHLDYLAHEAFYRVDGGTTAFRVLWFGVPTADGVIEGDRVVGRGALLRVADDPRDDGYVTGWFEATREGVGELVDRGALDRRDAVGHLVDRLRRFAADRELIVDPGRGG